MNFYDGLRLNDIAIRLEKSRCSNQKQKERCLEQLQNTYLTYKRATMMTDFDKLINSEDAAHSEAATRVAGAGTPALTATSARALMLCYMPATINPSRVAHQACGQNRPTAVASQRPRSFVGFGCGCILRGSTASPSRISSQQYAMARRHYGSSGCVKGSR